MSTVRELKKLRNGKEMDIEYPISLRDKDGKEVYFEESNGYWRKREYHDGNETYYENSYGHWWKREYKDGKVVYFEESDGHWWRCEHDKGGNAVYYEDSNGYIEDNRETVDLTMEEVCKMAGKKVRIVE